jgi:putative CocE/NonD family hydrolase
VNRRDLLLGAASIFALVSAPGVRAAPVSDTDYDPQIRYNVKIPMRDGVPLSAILFLPRGIKAPRPAIFSIGPYTADWYHPEGIAFASHNFVYLAVDERGRGDSEGGFEPFFRAPDDGHDLVEWIAKQPWCNGKVAGNGHSYVGFTQWAAVRGGARLATIVPASACWVGYDFPLRNNIFYPFLAPWLTEVDGHTRRKVTSGDGDYWNRQFLRFYEAGLPFKQLGAAFDVQNPCLAEWMKHPRQSDYWDRANPTPAQFADLTIPVLTLCGQYDGDQPGALEFHRQHLAHAGTRANHYLVIGPWEHEEVRVPKPETSGFKLGPASVIDMLQLHRDWYRWTLDGGEKPAFLQKKVAYYVVGADRWRYADTLDGVTARHEALHLQSATNPIGVYVSGALAPHPADKAEPDHYIYDPRDLGVLRVEAGLTKPYITDQTLVLAKPGAKLVYHGEPFEAETEVSGVFKFTAWIAIDQPDTDFHVAIYDVDPDGSSVYLTEQTFRARYREGLRIEKLIETHAPLRYEFDRFQFISRVIGKGHRLRLVFGPNHSLGWEKNYNSGKAVADQTMADARAVTVRLFHDGAHPSVLHVPIGQPEA